ncbi:MAG: Ppx/GppA phosphatase family protein [Methanomassiliicoccales archaeon]|nr:Ppx/GppA phosphatase family protein [Methanomassiliicoccales archaeon]
MANEVDKGKVVAFLDVGTNSVRLLVVRINLNRSYTVISEQKEMVRLGETEFQDGLLKENAIERAVRVLKNFCDLSRTYGATEFVAMATSATREASNRMELIERMKETTGVELKIISGLEEARLIYLGVSSGHHLGRKTALFVDIGGGSTELILGDQREYTYLESMKVGAIRLTAMFVKKPEGSVSDETLSKMRKYIKSSLVRAKKEILQNKVGLAFGSSGTIMNLGDILAKQDGLHPGVIRHTQLKKLVSQLAPLDLAGRQKVPGINPERADIIVAGALILETVMDELKITEIAVSGRSMRDGMLMDYLGRLEEFPGFRELSVRERSVIQLGRNCSVDEEHARWVTTIALELYDSAVKKGLHGLGKGERELLRHAAFLHDVGDFISYNDHHLHSQYIINHAELLGFSSREVQIMANLAKYHRKRMPKERSVDLRGLDDADKMAVVRLSTLLRMAESLDRSHSNLVQSVRFSKVTKGSVRLIVTASGDPQLEMWRLEEDRKTFKKAFGKELTVMLNRTEE